MTIPRTIDGILEELAPRAIRTEDGTVIITDPELGISISRRTRAEAEAEVRRLKAIRRAA